MAAKGVFLLFTVPQIEAIVAKATTLLTEGKTVMEYSDSGTSVSKQFPIDISTTLVEARYALQVKAPEVYGPIDKVRVGNLLNNFRGL